MSSDYVEEQINGGFNDESQMDDKITEFVDENGFRYEKNEEGRWCLLIMSKFCQDE